MHPLFSQAIGMTHDVNGAAIEVHQDKGPGLPESIYEWCLTLELDINKAQRLGYKKLLDIPLGLIINFNVPQLNDGLSRLIIPGSNLE